MELTTAQQIGKQAVLDRFRLPRNHSPKQSGDQRTEQVNESVIDRVASATTTFKTNE
jgi:hypothetical protein